MRLLFVAAVAVFLQATPAVSQQKPAPPQGAISGTVIDGATGAAVADAFVTLNSQPVTLLPADFQNRQITDAKGRFVFMNLPDGRFEITAGKFGYLDGGYGRDSGPTDPLRTIVVSSGAWAGGLKVIIWRPSTISGTVRDETGEPVIGVFVRALAKVRIGGRQELAAGPITVTDDAGQYRLQGLLPGRYVIQVPSSQVSVPAATRIAAATTNVPEGAIDIDDSTRLLIGRYPLPPPPANGRAMTYGAAFHPNVISISDSPVVEIRFGDDRTGIDVALTPVPAVRVSGVVEGPPDALTTMTLRLLPVGLENLGLGAEAATALVGANGSFTLLNVPAGAYIVDAPLTFNQYQMTSGITLAGGFVGSRGGSANFPTPQPRGGWSSSSQGIESAPGVSFSSTDFRGAGGGTKIPAYTARMPVTVGASDLTGLVVKLRQNASLKGRLIVDADPAKPVTQTSYSTFMDPAAGQPGLGQPRTIARPGEEFEITGIQAGEYFLRVQTGGQWLVKSIEWRSRDYTVTPFDATSTDEFTGVMVTVTNRVATLTGAVRAQGGGTPESALVVIFPAQSALRVNTGLWSPRMTSTLAGNTGSFRFNALPAGDYVVAAIDRSQMATWRDPAFLAMLERQATRVTLDWGQTLTQDLTLVTVR
jgi:hypothetical protein